MTALIAAVGIGRGEGMTNPYVAPEDFPGQRAGSKLPEWARVGAAVRFRATGGEVVECWVDEAGQRGILLSNGERFGIGHLRRGNSDAASYFEKYDVRGGIRKTVRRA